MDQTMSENKEISKNSILITEVKYFLHDSRNYSNLHIFIQSFKYKIHI